MLNFHVPYYIDRCRIIFFAPEFFLIFFIYVTCYAVPVMAISFSHKLSTIKSVRLFAPVFAAGAARALRKLFRTYVVVELYERE